VIIILDKHVLERTIVDHLFSQTGASIEKAMVADLTVPA
jgi:hypothetical protein